MQKNIRIIWILFLLALFPQANDKFDDKNQIGAEHPKSYSLIYRANPLIYSVYVQAVLQQFSIVHERTKQNLIIQTTCFQQYF